MRTPPYVFQPQMNLFVYLIGYLTIQDTLSCPNGVRFRGVPLYSNAGSRDACVSCTLLILRTQLRRYVYMQCRLKVHLIGQ